MGEWTGGRRWIAWLNSEKVAKENYSEYVRIMRHIGMRKGGAFNLERQVSGMDGGWMDRNEMGSRRKAQREEKKLNGRKKVQRRNATLLLALSRMR